MKTQIPQTIYLKEYQATEFAVNNIDLIFNLDETKTIVTATQKFELRENLDSSTDSLFLNGEELKLISIKINGEEIQEGVGYELDDSGLTILNPLKEFVLVIENEVNPTENTALDGLYYSSNMFCTQNEAQGFRRITFCYDRPDVLSVYTTKIIADKKKYPTLLSNGNPTGSGELEGDKHWASWKDPFPKPCYLYALVAGEFDLFEDNYTTSSGRNVLLQIFCDKGQKEKCSHAMISLKKSMKWDEDRFGLEYDLDIYMIVAVGSFNMGAMENKGLNVFNSALVLANQETATDANFMAIEGVIGHEYFHNWTGNRVTCRDWFQLTLKEGLTVFRDQEFSSDMNSRAVQRIEDVNALREHQFAEDEGPTAHPIKPSSYIEINNFYTSTVYQKGSEVIRMIHTLLGEEGFRKGMDQYFELHDGQAVTTEDFINAMSIANNNYDFTQFKNWYSQAGTPKIKVTSSYNEELKKLTLTIEQSCEPSPNQEEKDNYVIPLKFGLLNKDGTDFPIDKNILILTGKKHDFVFENIENKPVLSINRGFSAPVITEFEESDADLAFKMSNDSDSFNRFESAQNLAVRTIMNLIVSNKEVLEVPKLFLEAYSKVLNDETLDDSIKHMTLSLPTEITLHRKQNPINFKRTHEIREFVRKTIAKEFKSEILNQYEKLNLDKTFEITPTSIGNRSLKNYLLSLIVINKEPWSDEVVYSHYKNANNMTDQYAALDNIITYTNKYTNECVKSFHDQWKHESLVIQKWLFALAGNPCESTLDRIKELEKCDFYDETVPNFVRSLVGRFGSNPLNFHHESGSGYEFMADKVIHFNKINPQVASRLISHFKEFKNLEEQQKKKLKNALERIINTKDLSPNVFEIANKIFKS